MSAVVYAFLCGTLTVPRSFFSAGAPGDFTVPIPAFLVQHERGVLIFDTGLNRLTYSDPLSYMDPEALKTRRFHFSPEQELPSQLRAAGFDPDTVRQVANSHLHYDHCGGNGLFPLATVLLQRAEWEAVQAAPADSTAYRRADFDTGQDIRLLDGVYDVFQDGSVVLEPTYGHTPGHQSLIVKTDDGVLVLAADACYERATLSAGQLPGILSDADAVRRVLADFRARQARGESIVYGHDPEFWAAQSLGPTALHPLQPVPDAHKES